MSWLAQYLATPVTPLFEPEERGGLSASMAAAGKASARRREEALVARYRAVLENGPLTTPEIGNALGILKPNGTMYKLEQLGLVEVVKQVRGPMGRKTNLWRWKEN